MVDEAQQRALPRAARPHDDDHLPLLHVEVDSAQHLSRAISLMDVADRNEGLRPAVPRRSCAELANPVERDRPADRLDFGSGRKRGGSLHGLRLGRRRFKQREAEQAAEARSASSAAVNLQIEAPLEQRLSDRNGAGHGEIDDAGRGEHREEPEVLPDDLLTAERQLVDEDHRGDRRPLDHADHVIGHARQDRLHGLRQDDAAQGQERAHAEGGCGDSLAAVHGQDAAANDLSAERRLVQGEAEHCGCERIEGDSEGRQRVVDEDKLQELRRASHEPDVEPGDGSHRRPAGHAHERKPQTQNHSPDHRERRDLDRKPCALQQKGVDDIAQHLADRRQRALRGGRPGGLDRRGHRRRLGSRAASAPHFVKVRG